MNVLTIVLHHLSISEKDKSWEGLNSKAFRKLCFFSGDEMHALIVGVIVNVLQFIKDIIAPLTLFAFAACIINYNSKNMKLRDTVWEYKHPNFITMEPRILTVVIWNKTMQNYHHGKKETNNQYHRSWSTDHNLKEDELPPTTGYVSR